MGITATGPRGTPFAFVKLPRGRSLAKPRQTGLTMMVDFGLPYRYAADVVDMAARYIDFAKFAVGTSRLYEIGYLRRKLGLHKKHRIRPFIGGQFREYVFATYGAGALRVGLGVVGPKAPQRASKAFSKG
jgi:phosphosulfolactate synthase